MKKNIEDRNIELRDIHQSILKARSEEAFDIAFNALTTYLERNNIIKNVPFNYEVLQAIYQFRNHNEPKGPMTSGKHHNYKLTEEVSTLYNKNYEDFGIGFDDQWDSPKNLLCWQKIVGYTDRFLPACDAQVAAQGAWFIFEEGEKSLRVLDFRYGLGKYYPLNSDPTLNPGYGCGMTGEGWEVGRGPGLAYMGRALIKTMSSKNIMPGPKLMRQFAQPLKSHCAP